MFRRSGGFCVAKFDRDEARILRQCAAELAALLNEEPDPGDIVRRRLFPDAYPDSPEDSADFHRLTRDDLTDAKLDQAKTVLGDLVAGSGSVKLDEESAEKWLRALTDIRLALGLRLGVKDETDIEEELDDAVLADPTSPRVSQIVIYSFLGLLQESLVQALTH
jgi:hypothetical protein